VCWYFARYSAWRDCSSQFDSRVALNRVEVLIFAVSPVWRRSKRIIVVLLDMIDEVEFTNTSVASWVVLVALAIFEKI